MLTAIFIQLFITYVVVADSTTQSVFDQLKERTNQFQATVRACLLTDLFIKFKEEYQLLGKNIRDATALVTEAHKVKTTISDTDLRNLYAYYSQQEMYLNQVESRNRLVFYINSHPLATCLDRSEFLKVFFETHRVSQSHVTNFDAFKSFMHEIDHRTDLKIIKMLYPHVYEYQKHEDRFRSRVSLETGAQGKTFAQLATIMDPFLTQYKIKEKDVSQLRTFRRLVYAIDFIATDEQTAQLHPYVKSYKSTAIMKDKREKLDNKIKELSSGGNLVNSHEINFEAWQFFNAYKLHDTDITNLNTFKNYIASKDDSITAGDAMLPRLHPHVVRYMKYVYKIEVRKMMLNLIRNPLEQSILEISSVVDSFIGAYNILDQKFTNGARLHPYIFRQDGLTTLEEADEFYALYVKYKEHMELEYAKDILLHLLQQKPRESRFYFDDYADALMTKYDLYQYGISRLNNFLKYMKLKNPMVTEKEAVILHPIMMKFLEFKRKESAYVRLLECIESNDPVKPDIDSLSEKAIRVLGLNEDILSNEDNFKQIFAEIYVSPNEEKIKKVFSHLVEYQKVKSQKTVVRELRPGDITIDGDIVPPSSGSELSWYNFFKFFNALPHIKKDISRLDNLTPFQQWFNDFYKQRTGIHYYFIDPLVALGLSRNTKPTADAHVVAHPRASQNSN